MSFVKGECLEKRQFCVKSVTLVFIGDAHRYREETLVQYCVINVPSSEVNESPTDDQNQSSNFLTNIIVTLI